MGYAGTKLRKGFTPTGANFINVSGGTTLHLGDLKPIGYGDVTADMIYAEKLDASGACADDKSWTFYDLDDEDEDVHLHGWYDLDGDDPVCVDKVIEVQLGEGVWVGCDDEENEISIQCAGEVYSQNLPIQLRPGFTLCANPCPAAIKIGTLIVNGYEDVCADVIYAEKLDASGACADDKSWTFYDLDDEDEDVHLHGWYDLDGDDPVCVDSVIEIGVGEALWVGCDDADTTYTLTFPTALGK